MHSHERASERENKETRGWGGVVEGVRAVMLKGRHRGKERGWGGGGAFLCFCYCCRSFLKKKLFGGRGVGGGGRLRC